MWIKPAEGPIDRSLLLSVGLLIALGLLMLTSASLGLAQRELEQPFYFVIRQSIYFLLGISAGLIIICLPIRWWQQFSPILLMITIALLMLVLIPGIGTEVNGSRRWLRAGPFSFQVAELAKLFMIIYLADYLDRNGYEVRTTFMGFLKPMFIVGFVGFLLLLQPDMGSAFVIAATVLGLMFLAQVRLREFIFLLILGVGLFVLLAWAAPYRWARLTSFMDPWADQFNTGYQLTQALIAFGRGEWFGVGLGEGIQKLFYLPEAHTDFLFAVIAEELGLWGSCLIIALFALMVYRILLIASQAQKQGRTFAAFLSYGVGLWIACQAIISIGVNSGILPTKGLTLPLMSYGGSSLLLTCMGIALVCRVHYENNT